MTENKGYTLLRSVAGKCFYHSHRLTSALGEKLGWEWLIYNPLVVLSFERAARRNAPKFADAVLQEFPSARSLVDVGCGSGGFALEFQNRGLRVAGCEYAAPARRRAQRKNLDAIAFDVSKDSPPPAGSPFDLVITLEVGEHIPAALADSFVQYLVRLGDLIVFTSAQRGQGGHGHINEQPKTYWTEKFEAVHFQVDQDATDRIVQRLIEAGAFAYLIDNLLVVRRKT